MSESSGHRRLVSLDTSEPVWERFFTIAPLVLVGTRDEDGALDLAPKHMAMPLGWQNYFGFVCSPRHSTCSNIERTGEFTISFPKPSQILYTSLAASPRIDGCKPVLDYFETFPSGRARPRDSQQRVRPEGCPVSRDNSRGRGRVADRRGAGGNLVPPRP